ncbi:MAG: hypothetical protein ACR2P1_07445 [Pseudomonadales bacterium]
MLSQADDCPIHQIAAPVRYVDTSDRNFYDRYYFNMHNSSDELFVVMGFGQYPNLNVQDAFAVIHYKGKHTVVRASRELGDRMDTSVGPFRIKVIEGLKKVRFVLEPNDHGLAMDLIWEGAIPAHEEPQHVIRQQGRVFYDSKRFAQTGYWSGTLQISDDVHEVTPDRWKGTRDRSWGVRPVGAAEPEGFHKKPGSMSGMWNYAPMQFDDYTILYICSELNDGHRELEEAVRVWNDPAREPEHLGRPEYDLVFDDAKDKVVSASISFPEAPEGPISVQVTPLIPCYVMIGTGYGIEKDWKHGMYQGRLVVQGLQLDMVEDKPRLFGLIDSVARFELNDEVGYGLFEYSFMGKFEKYGFTEEKPFWNLNY